MVYAACIEADTRQRTAELKTMYGWRWQKAGKRIRDSEINLEQKKWIEGVMLSSMTVKQVLLMIAGLGEISPITFTLSPV